MRKQNMAGRIALAAATVLLCAVFVTTSVLSTTFAKYTTTGEVDSETARVAKWGIKLSNSSNADTEWTVVENGTSITAASSGTTGDKIIAPGTSGYLACFRVEGNPEVAHNVTMNFNVTIPEGYKKLIGQNDYFPILISVGRASYKNGSNEAIDRREIHYYVPKYGPDTLADLISAVDSEIFFDNIAPNGWSKSDYAEYYVRWDWFYNADDVPSYIPEDVKTALTEYQRSEKDTLLSEAMVLQLGKEKVKGSIETLKTALATAKTKLNGTPTATDVTNLESALATYLGVGARSYDFDPPPKEYNVRWSDLHNQGAMIDYDNSGAKLKHNNYFNIHANTARITASRKVVSGTDLSYFTGKNSSFLLSNDTYFEMTFKAANYVDCQYAGVVFLTRETSTGIKPFFYYGGLGGVDSNNINDDAGKNHALAAIEIDWATYNSPVGGGLVTGGSSARGFYNIKKTQIADTGISSQAKYYGDYKVIYDKKVVSCYYKNTSSTYSLIAKMNLAAISDPLYLSVGILSRDNDSTRQRTMVLRDVVITQKIDATAKSVLQGLVNEVQSIVDAHSTDRDFTISANATIAITQTKSEPNP